MQEDYRKWYSHHLGRDIEMLVYGNWGYPVLMFPTSMGHYYEYKDFGLIDTARWFVETGKVKLYCIDSIDKDSWYAKHLHPGTRIWNHVLYDKFLHEELVPGMQRECNVQKIGVSGASFGGYHALNYAFRHPEQVGHLLTMGAAFNIKSFLGGYYDDNVYYNNPPDFMPNAQNDEFHHMNIVLGTSEYDFCKPDNYQMSGILSYKGIRHQLDVTPWGNHDWPVWKDQFPRYLSKI
ncbi:esterase family protein [Spirosoma sp. BT702]|uniref:Esterase family protein n=1 Tax=Spirosoma profusum TaxID=2771354 RepID=A0A927ASM6_9BACT|nr:alpha/beta hydrolase-fold protein [Spirosoma profusum]MBD2704126.1 esterase family protein [Spirosoma profusum]